MSTGKIKYCLNSSTIQTTGLMDKIRIASSVGFEGIELWIDELIEYEKNGQSLDDISKAIDDFGLKVPTCIALSGWLGSKGKAHAMAIEAAKIRMEKAALVGAEYVIASPPMEPLVTNDGPADYRELLQLGEQIGVKPAMEYLGFVDSVYTIDQAWEIVMRADREDGTLIMDPFHILRGGGSVDDILRVPIEKVAIWHWNDVPDKLPFSIQSDSDRVMPGDGIGPLREIEQLVREQGYHGYVSLELFNPGYWKLDPMEVATMGMEKMQAYFAQ